MPGQHSNVEQWYYENLEIGQVYNYPSQTITETHFQLFAAITGDFHPIHMDENFVRKQTDFKGRVAHGSLVSILTVLGASPSSYNMHDSTIAFLSQSSKFLKPVYIGDSLYPESEIVNKERKKDKKGIITHETRVFNQDDAKVLEGEIKTMVRTRD